MFEYLQIITKHDSITTMSKPVAGLNFKDDINQKLGTLGSLSWELVIVTETGPFTTFYFKRLIPNAHIAAGFFGE